MLKRNLKYIFLIFVIMIIFIPNVYACTGSDGCTNCGNSSAEIACKKSPAYQQYLQSQQPSCTGNSGCTNCGSSSAEIACKQSSAYQQYLQSQPPACSGDHGCVNCPNSSAETACKQSSSYQQYVNSGGTSGGTSPGTNSGTVTTPGATINKTDASVKMEKEEEVEELDCGIFSEDTATGQYLHDIYNIMKFAVPIILLALSIVDFAKAIINDDSDAIKKATTTFSKRLIVAVLILILPTLLNFVLELFGIENCFKF